MSKANPAAAARRAEACERIVQQGRRRRYAMRVQQQLDRALESYVRRNFTAWDSDDSEAKRAKQNAATHKLIAAALDGEGDVDLIDMVTANEAAREPYDEMRQKAEKAMTTLAAELPVAPFVESVRGAGLLGLASIIAETGSLDNYANPAKLWARLGFAPFEGAAMSTYRRPTWRPRALSDDEWIDHPFSPERYAHMAMLAKPLRDLQWIGAAKTDNGKGKPNGPYGRLYAKRRKHCDKTHPDWSDMHRDRDALRVMFKQFLVDLWKEWRDQVSLPATTKLTPIRQLPRAKAAASQLVTVTQRPGAGGGHLSATDLFG